MRPLIRKIFIASIIFIAGAQLAESQISWTEDNHNPVLKGAGVGNWNSEIGEPVVLYNQDKERYEMWFIGFSENTTVGPEIGFAHSADGVSWTMHDAPVFMIDGTYLYKPSIIYENGEYNMWYVYDLGEIAYNLLDKWGIGKASSPDGINWTIKDSLVFKSEEDSTTYFACSVIKEGENQYRMWLEYWDLRSEGEIKFLYLSPVSNDGVVWTITDTTDLTNGKVGQWDLDIYFGGNSVILYKDIYYMWYSSYYVSNNKGSIGLASSEDGIHWRKYNDPSTSSTLYSDSDPVLDMADAGNFKLVRDPSVLLEGDTLRMWHTGYTIADSWCIGHAWSNFDTISTGLDPGVLNPGCEDEGVLLCYPNPTNSILTIETLQPGLHSIEITSLNGQLIYKEEIEGTTHQIDISSFSKGVYFVTVRSKAFVRTEKIVKL